MKKNFAIIMTVLMVMTLFAVPVSADAWTTVREAALDDIYIDTIDSLTLDPSEEADLVSNGLTINVSGFVGYTTGIKQKIDKPEDKNFFGYELTELSVVGQKLNYLTSQYETAKTIYQYVDTPLVSDELSDRNKVQGKEFSDVATEDTWTVNELGTYRVYATAKFTTSDTLLDDTENFEIVVSQTFIVQPMAAPNIAEIILERSTVNPNQFTGKGKDRTGLNLISEVAKAMGPQTYFYCEEFEDDYDGGLVPKSIPNKDGVEVSNPDYWTAVLNYLNSLRGSYSLEFAPLTYSHSDYIDDMN